MIMFHATFCLHAELVLIPISFSPQNLHLLLQVSLFSPNETSIIVKSMTSTTKSPTGVIPSRLEAWIEYKEVREWASD